MVPTAVKPGATAEPAASTAVAFSHVSLAFDDAVVLRDLSFSIPKGSMRMLLGASGSGKSVVLKLILGLLKPDAGTIEVNGQRIDTMTERELLRVRADIGMVFQENALFDSLTVAQNVGYRLSEEAGLSPADVQARVEEVLGFIGLGEYMDRLPSELSGGQRRRVAIARAMAPEPGLLLFDDPITGLDPLVATVVDNEIIKLRDLEDVTSIVVTHQIRDAVYIATHEAVRENGTLRFVKSHPTRAHEVKFMVLHEGRLQFEGSAADLLGSSDPYLRDYMHKTLPPW
ncbi:MAG: ATP-binding cassette domain-containing protein [Acidobacteria bacterium]|nr:ATP-binding cassette domain-containing protein [Acidobacteriota bacterium]